MTLAVVLNGAATLDELERMTLPELGRLQALTQKVVTRLNKG